MNRSDLFMMALQNLWARKSRTLFNIFGIVVSCSMLLLVLAGTRGAHNGLMNLFAKSDFARHFAITPGRDRSAEPAEPTSKSEPSSEGIAEDRLDRINEKLTLAWERKNYPMTRVSLEKLDEFRKLSTIASVIPRQSLRTNFTLDNRKISSSVTCFSPQTSNIRDRIVAGLVPQDDSARGKVWIDEYRAWQLGFETDQQLADLIGTPIKLRFEIAKSKPSAAARRFTSLLGVKNTAEAEQVANTFRKLFAELDQTSLSDLEKDGLRSTAARLGLDTPKANDSQKSTTDLGFIIRDFEIAGIVKPTKSATGNLFQLATANRGNDLMIDWRDFDEIERATFPNRSYYYSIGSVENASDLATAVGQVEQLGFTTRSALYTLNRAEEELGKVRLIVAAIALVILLIASVGIMNTMIIAVMERTPEFGIMKAVGAKDSDIRWLMLIEAALTGILGAIASLGATLVLDVAISRFARRYIETRIEEDFDFRIFVYSISDILIVAAIAITICMLASLLPSRRAAKLDPVEAMK